MVSSSWSNINRHIFLDPIYNDVGDPQIHDLQSITLNGDNAECSQVYGCLFASIYHGLGFCLWPLFGDLLMVVLKEFKFQIFRDWVSLQEHS